MQSRESLANGSGIGSIGRQFKSFLQVYLRLVLLGGLVVSQSEMVVQGGIRWILLGGFLKKFSSGPVHTL